MLSSLVDTIFFASLAIEEGQPVRLAVVYDDNGAAGLANQVDNSNGNVEPELAWDVTALPAMAFDVPTLAKLARGIRYGTQLIVVGPKPAGPGLRIDGVARLRPRSNGGNSLRVAAPRPGAIVFESGDEQILRYEGGERLELALDVIGQAGPIRKTLSEITTAGWSHNEPGFNQFSGWPIQRLIQKMRATGAGAVLALMATEPTAEMRNGVAYGRTDPLLLSHRIEADSRTEWASTNQRFMTHDATLSSIQVRERDAARFAAEFAREELEAAIDDVAQLSAIDGAVLAGPKLAIYGAGYLIPSVQLSEGVIRQALDVAAETSRIYSVRRGARHHAGFSFAYANRGAVAFIVSEDGSVNCALRIEDRVVVWPVEVLET